MQATFLHPLFSLRSSRAALCSKPRQAGCLLAFCVLIACGPFASVAAAQAQRAAPPPLGIAWQVRGQWLLAGSNAALSAGDAVPPGALLQPDQQAGGNSILIFLPDGQRIFYECFTAADCARGFRVPPLYRRPEPFAVDMLARIRAAAALESGSLAARGEPRPLPRDEVVAVLGADHHVHVAGLAANLPNGHYTYDLRPIHSGQTGQSRQPLEKTGSSLSIAIPAPGLYDLRISDERNVQRIDLFIAAVSAASSTRIAADFKRASTMLGDWNIDYQGWPIHEFQWAFLEATVLNLHSQRAASPAKLKLASAPAHLPAAAAEPVFTPRPGVFKGDTVVTLHCATPGATIRFTVDNSQPLASSPVYAGSISVKGTELTVKAYATAPGKKDSPVVTGIFRIDDDQ